MKLSDYVAEFLVEQGVRHVFAVTGGAAVHLLHSLADNPDINYICPQHEQAGAMAAEAYSRFTKNLGVAMATSGPGMTNLLTGIGCAYFDSTPTLYLTGQVNTNESKEWRKVRQVGFQETDIVEMVKPITKYSHKVDDPESIRYELEKAVYIAKSGRPGPVLLDIPMNVQRAEVNPKKLRRFKASEVKVDTDSPSVVRKSLVSAMASLMRAKRPVVIAGGGIRYSDTVSEFLEFAETLGAPVVATWSGIDLLHHDHRLYRGQIGVYGSRAANFAVQNSDCIISFGSRLDTRITGGKPETFARLAKKIVIDIDRAEIFKKRGFEPDTGICADLRDVFPILSQLSKKKRFPDYRPWLALTAGWVKEYPSVPPEWHNLKDRVNPYVFIEELSNKIGNGATVVTDCGANLCWTIQAFHVQKGQRLFSAMGNSPMAYAVPAAMGASIALGKKPVVCIIGDGGLQMNIQEFQTLVYYGIPVKIFVLNNHSYGIIKQFEEAYFGGQNEGTSPKSGYSVPDFIKIAKAYGIPAFTLRSHTAISEKIRLVMETPGPALCDVVIPDDSKIIPKLLFGNSIENLSPELSQNEISKHTII